MHLDLLERQVATRQIAAIVAMATGAEGVEIPTLEAARVEFDEQLTAEPDLSELAGDRLDMLEALGVR